MMADRLWCMESAGVMDGLIAAGSDWEWLETQWLWGAAIRPVRFDTLAGILRVVMSDGSAWWGPEHGGDLVQDTSRGFCVADGGS